MDCLFCGSVATVESCLLKPGLKGSLVNYGDWRCLDCGKEKKLVRQATAEDKIAADQGVDHVINSIRCHACNDKGYLHHYDVIAYIVPKHFHSDAPVACNRCEVGHTFRASSKVYHTYFGADKDKKERLIVDYNKVVAHRCQDLASKEECETLHMLNLQKAMNPGGGRVSLQKAIADLGRKMTL